MENNMICEGPQLQNSGWICPRCGASVAPGVKICPVCSESNKTIVYTAKDNENTTCSWNCKEGLNGGEQMIFS